jgi:hypothetical protein
MAYPLHGAQVAEVVVSLGERGQIPESQIAATITMLPVYGKQPE